MTNGTLTADRLREVLRFDSATGEFYWLCPTRRRIVQGAKAGTLRPDGYRRIRIDNKTYLAHRLAWLYVHGEFPASKLDHSNRNRDDNRLANLRTATDVQNSQNRVTRPPASGLSGAVAHGSRWQSHINAAGKRTHLGTFDTAEEAHAAYIAARRELHPFWIEAA